MAKSAMSEAKKAAAIVMTKLSIEKLALEAGQEERYVYDQDHSRLALRLRRNAGGRYSYSWIYLYMFAGRRRKYYIGTYPKCSIKQAHANAVLLAEAIASGIDPKQAKFEREEHGIPLTFGELYERWYHEVIVKKREKSHGHVAQIFRDHIFYSPSMRTMLLGSVKPHVIKKILDKVLSKGKHRTLVMTLQLLKQMFRWGERLEYIERNPAMAFTDSDFVSTTSRERYLDRSEIAALIQGMDKAQIAPQLVSAIMLILATGNRSTETRLIRTKDVDLEARTISIPVENQKKIKGVKKKTHVVHLSDFALKHVEKLMKLAQGSEYLIPHLRYPSKRFKEPISKTTLMQQLARHDGVSPHHVSSFLQLKEGRFTIHDLRRTAASHMQELGISFDVIDKCQNHEIPGKVRRTYMRARMQARMASAWNRWGRVLQDIEDEVRSVAKSEPS